MGCAKSKPKGAHHSNEAVLRSKYEVEGYKDRIVLLYHVTSAEAAKAIVNLGKMLRGSSGMFGGGIYFASTRDTASHKAHYTGATIEADVLLGYSLVCRQAMYNMTHRVLCKTYGCNSVKGDGCVSNPEYVVYNWAQVSLRTVTIGYEVYYESRGWGVKHSCSNPACGYYKQQHIGKCRTNCQNSSCEYHGKCHLGACSLLQLHQSLSHSQGEESKQSDSSGDAISVYNGSVLSGSEYEKSRSSGKSEGQNNPENIDISSGEYISYGGNHSSSGSEQEAYEEQSQRYSNAGEQEGSYVYGNCYVGESGGSFGGSAGSGGS